MPPIVSMSLDMARRGGVFGFETMRVRLVWSPL